MTEQPDRVAALEARHMDDLQHDAHALGLEITGTGHDGRVLKADLVKALAATSAPDVVTPPAEPPVPEDLGEAPEGRPTAQKLAVEFAKEAADRERPDITYLEG